MYVPYQPMIRSGVSWRLPTVISELPPTRLMQLEQRLQDILGQAIVVTRGLLIAVGMSAFIGSTVGQQIGIGVALVISLVMLVLVHWVTVPYGVRLAVDGAVVALLITVTGGVMSPIIGLTLILIPLGALHGGFRDSVAATCIGIITLLMVGILDAPLVSDGWIVALMAQFVAGLAIAWMSKMVTGAVTCLYTGVNQASIPTVKAVPSTSRFVEWQRSSLSVVEARTQQELMRMARDLGQMIAGATVEFYMDSQPLPNYGNSDEYLVMSSSHGAERCHLMVHRHPATLDYMQHDALAQLLVLVRLRSATLMDSERRERDQQAMMVLWQMTGQTEPTLTQVEASQHLVEVLGLHGMAMVNLTNDGGIEAQWQTPDDVQLVSSLSLDQIAYIHEAVIDEQMITDHARNVLVVPLMQQSVQRQALVVHGAIDDEGVQRIMMIFADMVVRFCRLTHMAA
jgi:hypothetical protein